MKCDLHGRRRVFGGGRGGVELEKQPDVEQSGHIFGTLKVAAHPEQVFGDPAEHRGSVPHEAIIVGIKQTGPAAAVVQHPRVLGATTLRAVHDQASLRQRDPRQATRHDHDFFAIKYKWPEVDVPAVESISHESRVPAQADRRLGDIAPGVGDDLPRELVALFGVSMPGRSASRTRPSRRRP